MRIVGLDLSLTHTGIATDAGTRTVTPDGRMGVERLVHLRDHILGTVRAPALVVVEGYAYGSPRGSSNAHSLGELGGVVRVTFHEHGIAWVDVAPAALKKYATGKGNASKGLVLEAAIRRSPDSLGGDDNRADAWWLRQMGLRHYGEPGQAEVPKSHWEALAKVPWPSWEQLRETLGAGVGAT